MAVLVLLVCGLPVAFLNIHNWDITVAALAACYFAVLLVERPGPWPAFLSGLLTSVSILFNQARGAGLLAGVLLTFAWNFSQPLFSGLCCEADPEGRAVCAMG